MCKQLVGNDILIPENTRRSLILCKPFFGANGAILMVDDLVATIIGDGNAITAKPIAALYAITDQQFEIEAAGLQQRLVALGQHTQSPGMSSDGNASGESR